MSNPDPTQVPEGQNSASSGPIAVTPKQRRFRLMQNPDVQALLSQAHATGEREGRVAFAERVKTRLLAVKDPQVWAAVRLTIEDELVQSDQQGKQSDV